MSHHVTRSVMRRGASLTVVVMALAFGGLVAQAAQAGTLSMVFNGEVNAAPACDMWIMNDPYGSSLVNFSSWVPLGPCGPGAMYIANDAEGLGGPSVAGQSVYIETVAPAGIAINSATISGAFISNLNNGTGWGGGTFYAGGGQQLYDQQADATDSGFSSSYWGFQMICGWSKCTNTGEVEPGVITLTATENQGPALAALGSNNLWYQGGQYVWNPPGDPWPIPLQATDPSGVCAMGAVVNGRAIGGPSATPNNTVWHQCPDQTWQGAGASVDTRSFVPGAGALSFEFYAYNAAGVASAPAETLAVDNDPVSVVLGDPNDPNPAVWVNHAVTVTAGVTAGPSGAGGLVCSVDGAANNAYPAGGAPIDGNGVHTIKCTGWNRAIDPQDAPQSAASSQAVHIDEVPPALAFAPQNPSDPTQVVANTSDSESGVAAGSIQIAPAGTSSWTTLPTSLAAGHLIARFDDTSLRGAYVLRATSCDNAGNCAVTNEQLTLPLRLATQSGISFKKIHAPAKIVHRRIKVRGHYRLIKLVIAANQRCTHKRVKTAPHRWRVVSACRAMRVHFVTSERVGFGKPATVHGLLTTSQGAPIAGAPVSIQTAPDNELNQFTQAAVVTTDSSGSWTATLPAGPSRLIRAVFGGSATLLPTAGQATLSVPAHISLSIRPRSVAWSGVVTITGQLSGGYVPPDGVALRLLVHYPGTPRPTVLLALRTDASGRFRIKWSYQAGRGVATYPMAVATTATETDYAFAAARSQWLRVTFGRRHR